MNSLGDPLQFQHHLSQQNANHGSYNGSSRNSEVQKKMKALGSQGTMGPPASSSFKPLNTDMTINHYEQANASAQDYNYPTPQSNNLMSGSGFQSSNSYAIEKANTTGEYKLGNVSGYKTNSAKKMQIRSIDGTDKNQIASSHNSAQAENRKMSLAAKAGQMQIFNNYNVQGLNSNNDIQLNYNYQTGQQQHPSQQKVDDVIKSTKNALGSGLPPQAVYSNNSATQRQFDSYLGRRQIIQQQREKKQELLKQLEQGGRLNSQNLRGTQQMQISQNVKNMVSERNFKMQTQPLLNVSGLRNEAAAAKDAAVTHQDANGSGFMTKRRSTTHGQSVSVHVHTKDINFIASHESVNPDQVVSPERIGQRNPLNAPPSSSMNTMHSTNNDIDPAQRRRVAGLAIAAVANQQNGQLNTQLSILTNLAKKQLPNEIIGTGPNSTTNADKPTITLKDMPVVSGVSLGFALNPPQGTVTANNSVEKLQKAKEMQKEETTSHSKDLQKIVRGENIQQQEVPQVQQQTHREPQPSVVNSRITRKLEGGRPHKVYDYMFIQMSNEQFRMEYCGKKIIILGENGQQVDPAPQYYQRHDEQYQHSNFSPRKIMRDNNKVVSPYKVLDKNGKLLGAQSPPNSNNQHFSPNLNGLVQIKAYDNVITDELPMVQCNLLPTQLDHVKVLICEQEDKNYPKLTIDAANRFEIEKQNQIKQYMEDIIGKLQQKDRKFKVTVKKKFVEDALYNSTSIRVASVYVIVINREKAYDPLLNQKQYRAPRRQITNTDHPESSEEEEDNANQEPQRARKESNKKGNPIWLNNNLKRSYYDSDANGNGPENMNSTATSSNVPHFKKLLQDSKQKRSGPVSTAPNFKRANKKDEDAMVGYKYIAPVKEYPSKYNGPTKIKIIQDTKVHDHHLKHHLNIYFNQYNEFIKLIFKQKPTSTSQNAQPPTKLNIPYALGLSKALGLGLKKDAFSETNLKSREHLQQLKEKLIYCFYNKLNDSNKDLEPQIQRSNNESTTGTSLNAESELDGVESIDSEGKSSNNKLSLTKEHHESGVSIGQSAVSQQKEYSVQQLNSKDLPPSNVVYKYFIGKGNNSIMVRSLFKNRYWWMQHDKEEMEKCNFCWTQNKKQVIMDVLPCKYPYKKSGIKNNQFNQKSLMATPQNKSKKKKFQSSERNTTVKNQDTSTARTNETKLYNKIEDNFHMNNKKALFLNMKNYYDALDQDVFDNLPLTFHIKEGLEDPEFQRFKQYYDKFDEELRQYKKKRKEERDNKEEEEGDSPKKEKDNYYKSQAPPKNIWIIKPGENTNRGIGIQVAKEFNEIKDIIVDSTANRRRTCIVQKYIHNPLLIHRRKFDIRTYALMTSVNGNLKGYLYEEGYLRTSCREYSIANLSNKLVHLTNDAVQKRAEDYGKFEPGNKLSYNEFQAFIDKNFPDLNICFERDLLPQMNKMTVDIFRACHGKLDPKRRLNCMEVFGLDFMICDEFKPYLIEVNTNPCLELSSPLLARLIPNMLENALKIGLDTQFLPPEHFSSKKAFIGDACPENRFSLCYDDKIDGPGLDKLFEKKNNIIIEMDEDELSEDEHDD